jgi:hypothetical protein
MSLACKTVKNFISYLVVALPLEVVGVFIKFLSY